VKKRALFTVAAAALVGCSNFQVDEDLPSAALSLPR
jgi:hypothetical protein